MPALPLRPMESFPNRHPRRASEFREPLCLFGTESLEDGHLTEHVRRVLQSCGHPALRSLEILVGQRSILVKGQLPTHALRVLAIQSIQESLDDFEIEDRIIVTGSLADVTRRSAIDLD